MTTNSRTLLAEWLTGCCAKSKRRCSDIPADANPMDVYVDFFATAQFVRMYDKDATMAEDADRLASMIAKILEGPDGK